MTIGIHKSNFLAQTIKKISLVMMTSNTLTSHPFYNLEKISEYKPI